MFPLDEEWQKLVYCLNINGKNNIGYKIQYDRIAGIFCSDGEICGISDRNGIKEKVIVNPLIACHIVEKMINYTGTCIYSVSVFRIFHYTNSSYMDFECITWERDFAFKPGKQTGLLHVCISISAVRYQAPESEKQEALTHFTSFTCLDLATSNQRPSEYHSSRKHQHPLPEFLGALKFTGQVEGRRSKVPNPSKSQHQYLMIDSKL